MQKHVFNIVLGERGGIIKSLHALQMGVYFTDTGINGSRFCVCYSPLFGVLFLTFCLFYVYHFLRIVLRQSKLMATIRTYNIWQHPVCLGQGLAAAGVAKWGLGVDRARPPLQQPVGQHAGPSVPLAVALGSPLAGPRSPKIYGPPHEKNRVCRSICGDM